MELQIIDISWGIDRKSGQRLENEVANLTFAPVEVGTLPPLGPSRHIFKIEEVAEDEVVVLLSEKAGTVKLKKGEPYLYHPTSFDGGHEFKLILK